LYISLDDKSRRLLETKDIYIKQMQDKIADTTKRTRELRADPKVEKIIA